LTLDTKQLRRYLGMIGLGADAPGVEHRWVLVGRISGWPRCVATVLALGNRHAINGPLVQVLLEPHTFVTEYRDQFVLYVAEEAHAVERGPTILAAPVLFTLVAVPQDGPEIDAPELFDQTPDEEGLF
jgi:hypothetical protein